ncbi:hypothetical protein MRY87_01135 [bacterium]|nr:hypothetical protein [bacterium]
MSTELDQLLATARKVLAEEERTSEERLALLEEYSSLLEESSSAFERYHGGAVHESHREKLEELNRLHGLVLRRAQGIQGELLTEMKSVRTRGKALLKYIDVLPKRISSRRERKG